jgi:ABC-type transport system involved in Fe-S cluster assembly fused permease/ATPase subunit
LLKAGQATLGDFVMVVALLFSMLGTLTFIGSMMNKLTSVYGEIEEGLGEILIPHDLVDMPGARGLSYQTEKLFLARLILRTNKTLFLQR